MSDSDPRNLVEFWKQIYDIDIAPDEIPLLKIKMVNSENIFTYPSSMCFFAGGDSLVIPAGVQKFIEYKKSSLKARMDDAKGIIARPIGGTFLKHIVNVIVNLKENQYSTYKATLVKHQYVKTPKSAVLYTKKVGKVQLLY